MCVLLQSFSDVVQYLMTISSSTQDYQLLVDTVSTHTHSPHSVHCYIIRWIKILLVIVYTIIL